MDGQELILYPPVTCTVDDPIETALFQSNPSTPPHGDGSSERQKGPYLWMSIINREESTTVVTNMESPSNAITLPNN